MLCSVFLMSISFFMGQLSVFATSAIRGSPDNRAVTVNVSTGIIKQQ
jgi:hypothetical protein